MVSTATLADHVTQIASGPGPLLIATDLDGTLTPIVARPSDARVAPETIAMLGRLATVARVAIVTGRDLNTARRMIPTDSVVIIGSHGLESTIDGALSPEVDRHALTAALELVEARVTDLVPTAMMHIERKAVSTAFHYRRAPELEEGLRLALRELPASLRLREGRMVLEVLPNSEAGKDRALRALVRHFRPKSVLTIGDDVTDVAMLREAGLLRAQGTRVLRIGVTSGPETPAGLTEQADLVLTSSPEVIGTLESLTAALGA
jgi:trehalose 6-phosphate phosphatase